AYLHFEGPLSENRGSVRRADEGELVWLTPYSRESKDLHFSLAGKNLSGKFRLLLLGGDTYLFERICTPASWQAGLTPYPATTALCFRGKLAAHSRKRILEYSTECKLALGLNSLSCNDCTWVSWEACPAHANGFLNFSR